MKPIRLGHTDVGSKDLTKFFAATKGQPILKQEISWMGSDDRVERREILFFPDRCLGFVDLPDSPCFEVWSGDDPGSMLQVSIMGRHEKEHQTH